MRRAFAASFIVSLALATGCILTTDFGRFDTSPEAVVLEGGPPIIVTGKVTLAVKPGPVHVRPGVPAEITVHVQREGNAPPSAVTVRLEKLPVGLSSREAKIGPGQNEASIPVELASADAAAPLLGTVVTANVTGTVTDPSITSVASTSAAIEIWGSPGQIDPTRGGGTLAFNSSRLLQYKPTLKLPVRVADFVGTTLAVAVDQQLFTMDANSITRTSDIGAADAGSFGGISTAVADDDMLNVIANVLTPAPAPFTFDTRIHRGTLTALKALPLIEGGGRCAIDREGRRAACTTPADVNATIYKAPLRSLDGATPGAIIHDIDGADITTILHAAAGWVLVGIRLASPTNPTAKMLVELVDDAGIPAAGFSFESQTVPAVLFDAISDDAGILVAGADQGGAFLAKYGWTGAAAAQFGAGARVHVPGDAVLRLVTSTGGVLVASETSEANPTPAIGRITRLDPKTGAIDKSFGDQGTVTLPEKTAPVAVKETGSRILVGFLTAAGARVLYLFP